MNRPAVRWLLALYPRAWRDRYGAEVASLADELIGAGDSTPLRTALNLIAGAAIERGRARAQSRRAVLASGVAVAIAMTGIAFGLAQARPAAAPAGPASAACTGPVPVPAVVAARPAGDDAGAGQGQVPHRPACLQAGPAPASARQVSRPLPGLLTASRQTGS